MPEPKQINEIVAGLLGAIDVGNATNADAQKQSVEALRKTALGLEDPAPSDDDKIAAYAQLEAQARAAEIPNLDKAALALTGVTTLITGLFTGVGFSTGDFVRMCRDFFPLGLTFLVLASVALLLGTFAFVVNAYRSKLNLNVERAAVYGGIASAGVAFIFAAWGLSEGASAGSNRPTIQASLDASGSAPSLSVTTASSDVPRSEDLTTTIWGHDQNGWTILSHVVAGPTHDGSATDTTSVGGVGSYNELSVLAYLSSTDSSPTSQPPDECTIPPAASTTSKILASGPLPGPPGTTYPACDVLVVPATGSATNTTTTHG